MKRTTIAALWIAGATVPVLLATVFIFGCCVLPFHHVIHKLMPICSIAADFMRGDLSGHETSEQPGQTAQKESPKRLATELPNQFRLSVVETPVLPASPSPTTGYRSFISHGASRCDQDVGLYLVIQSFLI